MNQAADCPTRRQDGFEGAGNTAAALTGSKDASPDFGDLALGPTLFDSAAVWANEGSAGGEVVR
jgi:hypothetical protein